MRNTLRNILLPTIFTILAYGFWISPDFKEISAGVAIFLFGMVSLEEGFKRFTGGLLEKILKRTTDRLWKSISFGIVSTSIMQSSSLISIIAISFLGAGLIGLSQGIGIIFGANLGTTTGAWLIAGLGLKVNISAYAMPMLVFGVILIFQSSRHLKGVGYILTGLGFLFLGIHYMKEGFEAFKAAINLTEYAVTGYPGLFLFTLIGILATVIMQSSHATLVLVITALAAQQVSYENALALAIGGNIGTTITAVLGALGSNASGKRLAGAHFIFNMVTGLIAILFIHQFLAAVDSISAAAGIAETDYTLKLAVFHTLFNLVGIMVMIPFTNHLVRFLEYAIKAEPDRTARPKYLNASALEFAHTALEALRKETARIYEKSTGIITKGLSLNKKAVFSDAETVQLIRRHNRPLAFDIDAAYETEIKSLYSAVLDFINRLPGNTAISKQLNRIWQANQSITITLKDVKHLQKNMLRYIGSNNPHISEEYNFLRQRIANVLRRLEKIRNGDDSSTSILALDALKLTLEKNAALLHERMDQLIRNGDISAEMAISLMKDSIYTNQIIHHLIEANSNYLKSEEGVETEAEHLIALDRDEIGSVLSETKK
ncbi:MAG: Na/Pi symporter [Mariprofundaceae bacterium]|nr:Na/Pi symporter [Mariprofundaceae bacterium]